MKKSELENKWYYRLWWVSTLLLNAVALVIACYFIYLAFETWSYNRPFYVATGVLIVALTPIITYGGGKAIFYVIFGKLEK